MLFDEKQFDLNSHLHELKICIEKRSNYLLETIERWRKIYQDKINKYSEKYNIIEREVTKEFQSIDQRIQLYI